MLNSSVLFVCTGNIFRSMTAEFALKAALGGSSDDSVSSAGLAAAPHEIVPFVRRFLADKGIDIASHQPTVAMGTEHRARLMQDFGMRAPLFSEVAYDTVEALRDVYEVVPDWRNNPAAAADYGCSVMDYIFDGMPGFIRRMPSFLVS